MRFNPTAITLWIFGGLVGFLIAGLTGVVAGLAITVGLSLLSEFF